MDRTIRLRFVMANRTDISHRCTEEQRDAIVLRMKCGEVIYLDRDSGRMWVNPRNVTMIEECEC